MPTPENMSSCFVSNWPMPTTLAGWNTHCPMFG